MVGSSAAPVTLYSSMALSTYYIGRQVRVGAGNYNHYLYAANGTLLGSTFGTTFNYNGEVNPLTSIGFGSGSGAWNINTYVTWVRFRKFASPEPIGQVGVTESPPPPPPPSIISNTTFRTFTATWNQTVNVIWYWNSTSIQTNNSVTSALYTNSSLINGTHNITATGTNDCVAPPCTASFTWLWTISPAQAGEAIREFIQVIII